VVTHLQNSQASPFPLACHPVNASLKRAHAFPSGTILAIFLPYKMLIIVDKHTP
jgi:hypothetical protein